MKRDSYGRPIMSFGKHKGERISEIPDAYLRWCLVEAETLEDGLRSAIEIELRNRAGNEGSRSQSSGQQDHGGPEARLPVAVDRGVAAEIIAAGRRALALAYHPDRGGDAERMVKINATADHLQNRLAVVLGGQR